jgi:hypothetical protein
LLAFSLLRKSGDLLLNLLRHTTFKSKQNGEGKLTIGAQAGFEVEAADMAVEVELNATSITLVSGEVEVNQDGEVNTDRHIVKSGDGKIEQAASVGIGLVGGGIERSYDYVAGKAENEKIKTSKNLLIFNREIEKDVSTGKTQQKTSTDLFSIGAAFIMGFEITISINDTEQNNKK